MKHIKSKQPSSDSGHVFGTQDDYAHMHQMIWGFNVSQIVHTAALYSLPEHLAQRRATPAEIAKAESLNLDATFRLMRACASIRFDDLRRTFQVCREPTCQYSSPR